MRKLYNLSLFLLSYVCSFAQQQNIPVPKPHQLKWHEAELGAVFHYDLHPSGGTRLFAACSISGALSIDMNILDKGGNHHGYFWF